MSNNIETSTRAAFFPKTKSTTDLERARAPFQMPERNLPDRTAEIRSNSKDDARVAIGPAIKDFARIKKAVDAAPDIDNSRRIEELKSQIQRGTYPVDYEAIADKILSQEF